MTVQSARVQKIVKGDDSAQIHQIMEDVSFNAEASRAPVLVQSSDIATFFYPLEDLTQVDLTGYVGVAIGSYPTSMFRVPTPGEIIDPANLAPVRGTSSFQSGPGRTVRAEISRFQLTATGNTTINANTVASLSSTTGLTIGAKVVGAGIPPNTVVIAIVGSTITLSLNALATASGVSLSFYTKESHYSIDEVDIFERGFPNSLMDTSGGVNPPQPPLNLT